MSTHQTAGLNTALSSCPALCREPFELRFLGFEYVQRFVMVLCLLSSRRLKHSLPGQSEDLALAALDC